MTRLPWAPLLGYLAAFAGVVVFSVLVAKWVGE